VYIVDHPADHWSPLTDACLQVRYGILVYKGPARKYLTVRAEVASSGQMVHSIGEHEDRHCGYYQVSCFLKAASFVSPRLLGDLKECILDWKETRVFLETDSA
jgi:hypothetical protein